MSKFLSKTNFSTFIIFWFSLKKKDSIFVKNIDLNLSDSSEKKNDSNLNSSVTPLHLHSEWTIGAPQNISPVTTGNSFNRSLVFGHGNFTMGNQYVTGTRLSKNYVGDYLVFNVKSLTNLFLTRPVTDDLNFFTSTPKPNDNMKNDTGRDGTSTHNHLGYQMLS